MPSNNRRRSGLVETASGRVRRGEHAFFHPDLRALYRRRGLAVSLGAILLVVIALGLKVREIDRRHSSDKPQHGTPV
jgi:hypothetical protein